METSDKQLPNLESTRRQFVNGEKITKKIKAAAEESPRKKTVHSESPWATPELEDTLDVWVIEQRGSERNVSTTDIIDRALPSILSLRVEIYLP